MKSSSRRPERAFLGFFTDELMNGDSIRPGQVGKGCILEMGVFCGCTDQTYASFISSSVKGVLRVLRPQTEKAHFI
jgi:hypothetical protein